MVTELKQVQVGQKVDLQTLEFGYKLNLGAGGVAGQTVVEVGPDYIVIDDPTEGVVRRVPVYLIYSVTTEATPETVTAPQAA